MGDKITRTFDVYYALGSDQYWGDLFFVYLGSMTLRHIIGMN